jgi:hypothetical protein
MKSDLLDLTMCLHHLTERAEWLAKENGLI